MKSAIKLIPPTKKIWPKYTSIPDMPASTRRLLGVYIRQIDHQDRIGTDEGLFGTANILHRAGLDFSAIARLVYDTEAEDRIATRRVYDADTEDRIAA